MTTYLDITKQALAKIRAVRGAGYSLNQKCQQFVGYYMDWMLHGSEAGINTSGSAAIAASKRTLDKRDINTVPAGWLIYWSNNHVMRAVGSIGGRTLAANNSVLHGVKHYLTLDPFLYISYADTYNSDGAGHYIGCSPIDGTSSFGAPFAVEAWPPPVSALGVAQRKVKATGKVNRRTGPGTSYPEVTPQNDLAQNVVGNFQAFARGPASKGQPAGNNVWYQGTSGDWFWSGGFTTVDGTGLTDKTANFVDPVVVTPPVVVVPPIVVVPPVVVPDPPVVVIPDPPVVVAPEPPVVEPPVDTAPVVTQDPVESDPVESPPATTTPAPAWLGVTLLATILATIGGVLAWLFH